jgi:RHH-type rel operon transcriptional repressor/antitoxin RelB
MTISAGELTLALSIRLPEELEARLEKLSKTTGRTKTYYIREAVEEYLADLEDHYLVQKRMKDYDPDENVSLANLIKRHGVAR